MSDFELSDDEDEITENNSNESVIETPTNSVSTDQPLLAYIHLELFFKLMVQVKLGIPHFMSMREPFFK